MRTKKGARLGQHFLRHGWAAAKLAHAAPLRAGEVYLEIGPGKGVLTGELLKLGPVVAVEKDGRLCSMLKAAFTKEIASGQLRLVNEDIRDIDLGAWRLLTGPYVVAANIPYYLTGELIRTLLTAAHPPRAAALLVQKEVADRIVARDGKESILSISVKAYGAPRIIARVGRSHFSPPPTVDSSILLIDDISKRFFGEISERDFFSLIRKGFAAKRKFLKTNLGSAARFEACGVPLESRAEDLSLGAWRCLAMHAARD